MLRARIALSADDGWLLATGSVSGQALHVGAWAAAALLAPVEAPPSWWALAGPTVRIQLKGAVVESWPQGELRPPSR